MLDPGDPNHLWLLHVLFLDDIDEDCQVFRDEWNCHPISGPGMKNKSPQVSVSATSISSDDTECRIYTS